MADACECDNETSGSGEQVERSLLSICAPDGHLHSVMLSDAVYTILTS